MPVSEPNKTPNLICSINFILGCSIFNIAEIVGTEKPTLSYSSVPTITAMSNKMVGLINTKYLRVRGDIFSKTSVGKLSRGIVIVSIVNTPSSPRKNSDSPNLNFLLIIGF